MKNLSQSIFSLLLFLLPPAAVATNFSEVEKNLKPGQCVSDPESKVYVSSLVKSAANFRNHPVMQRYLSQQSEAVDTEDTNFYYCRLSCAEQNSNGNIEHQSVWMLHQDSTSRFSSMEGFLCAGVTIEQVNIVGSIYSPQPVTHPLWAFETKTEEHREWLRQTQFSLTVTQYLELKSRMQQDLKTIAMAYITSTSVELQGAGFVLYEIAVDSEVGRAALAERIPKLIQANWKFKSELSAESFINRALEQNARFLEFYSFTEVKDFENEYE